MTTNAYKEVKGKLDGLEDLRSGTAQPRWNGEQANLERKERELENEKKLCLDQVIKLQDRLSSVATTRAGNNFVTRRWGVE